MWKRARSDESLASAVDYCDFIGVIMMRCCKLVVKSSCNNDLLSHSSTSTDDFDKNSWRIAQSWCVHQPESGDITKTCLALGQSPRS